MPRDVAITGTTIRLGQLLKLADLADSGGDAKALLAAGSVLVNGEREIRRGRQLLPGDSVMVGQLELRLVDGGEPPGG
jgi:ribosome-associated protein